MVVLQNISKYYYTDTSVTLALRKIHLEFCKGEFVAITGESGSGKSTLLNVISGMAGYDEGEMFYDDEPTFQYDADEWEEFRRNRIGFVFQDYNLIGHYSALQNVVSALLIMGIEEKEAEERAMFYLEKVGLKGFEKQRASELSSGQKQRLSIARALAKETEVIVADEPTGNLDSGTGEQIIHLLNELSKDRLVLMVTHNFEQAAPYVSRKIRLHDGEVVEDVQMNEKEKDSEAEEEVLQGEEEKGIVSPDKVIQKRTAKIFARLNVRTQPGRAFLFRIFLLMTSVVSFIFIGQLFKNADDTGTRDYDNTIFLQKNDSRLSVSRKDGEAITKEDIKRMKSVHNVVLADLYDYANDINYYAEKDKDYHFNYGAEGIETEDYEWDTGTLSSLHTEEIPVFDNKSKFMKSIYCIEKDDLAAGRMPEKRDEIVLYSEDKKKLGQEIEIFFNAENITGAQNYYHSDFKIVGLLKEKTSQIYFHGDLCHMLSAPADGDQISMKYFYDAKAGTYQGSNQFYLVINDEMEDGMEARVSCNYQVPAMGYEFYSVPVEKAVPGDNVIWIKLNKGRKGISKELAELDGEEMSIHVGMDEFNNQSGAYLEVPQSVFDMFYPRKSLQASVYIKNYAKTDSVIRKLDKMGYTAISTFRISSAEYNPDKVMARLTFIAISAGILLALFIVGILILRALMKIKIKDFLVFKSMGMQLGTIRKISLYEMTRYSIEVMAVTVIVMAGLNLAGVPFISSMMVYFGVFAFVSFIGYNLLLEYVTVRAFNRLLRGRMMP